ncbi:hypothetical protein BKA64DRAFT_642939 [Cadophora sp. MPI-SDFR-AT-0126]|nr:hypothetical protein BKA64DRAFT_642939 [Leotiomycetes sp. MPI-SDFR-AT-0126]
MSLFNFLVSSALGVTPEELSAAQKATDLKKKKRKDSAPACVASSSSQSESSASRSSTNPNSNSTSEEGRSNKETREAESGGVSCRPEQRRGDGEGELPTYSEASGDPPAYSRESR